MRVVLRLSDPWELGEALGWPAIRGTVTHRDDSAWLVEIDKPFTYATAEFRFLVVSQRLQGSPLASATTEAVPCNMTLTTTERAFSESPCDLSWWRGGYAMIGTMIEEAAQHG
jgi:hypothetical protein